MQLFFHTPEKIRIINDAVSQAEFSCTPAQFLMLETDYPPLPEGMTGRYWTPETNHLTNGIQNFPEIFDGSIYCQHVNLYTCPCVFADISISKDRLCISDPDDTITFSAAIKDAAKNVLPVNNSWIIRLRDEDGKEVDAFEVTFIDGHTRVSTYTCPPGANLGRIFVDEHDFIPINVPGLGSVLVRLLNPIEFTLYRQLAEV